MRPITLPPGPRISSEFERWVANCLQEIERASLEDPAQIFDSYASDSIPSPPQRTLNVTTPTAANIAQVLASYFKDGRARGVNRTAPT